VTAVLRPPGGLLSAASRIYAEQAVRHIPSILLTASFAIKAADSDRLPADGQHWSL